MSNIALIATLLVIMALAYHLGLTRSRAVAAATTTPSVFFVTFIVVSPSSFMPGLFDLSRSAMLAIGLSHRGVCTATIAEI